MLDNDYVEELVKRKDPSYALVAKIFTIVLCMLTFLTAVQTLFGIVLFAAACVASYFIWMNLSVEYEYLYLDGELSIDKILNKNKRKKVVTVPKDSLLICAEKESQEVKDQMGGQPKIMDLTSHDSANGKKVYAYVANQGSERQVIYIEPSEKMLKMMKSFTPSKVKIGY